MEKTANADEEVLIISDDEIEVQDLTTSENEEKHIKKEIQNPAKKQEAKKGNVEDRGLNVDQSKAGVKDTEKNKHDGKSSKVNEETNINEIIDNARVKLSDGTEAPVYSRGPLYFDGTWPINCHVCGIHGISNSQKLSRHIKSDEHMNSMGKMPLDATTYRTGLNQAYSIDRPNCNNLIKIYPGEKITELTPVLQDRILPVQELIASPQPPEYVFKDLYISEPFHKKKKKAVIGLSYCFKMPYTTKSLRYFCALCEDHPEGSPVDPQHFVGPKHRIKYAEKHFPRLTSKISGFLSDMRDEETKQKIIGQVIQKVYRSIETKRGFREVHIVGTRIYPQSCIKFCKKIVHYEDNHVLKTDEELKEMTEQCRKDKQPPRLRGLNVNLEQLNWKTHSKGNAQLSNDLFSRKEESVQKSVPPLEDNPSNWDRYRRMVGATLDDLDERYADYKKIPENHPAYEREWKKFRNRRVKEIEKDGLDPDEYDFKTEWIPYWTELMQKLYTTSISKTKSRIKKSLCLPFDRRSPSPIRKQRSLRRMRSPSPERSSHRRRTSLRSPVYDLTRRTKSPPAVAKSSESPTVISVLRLLTALEDNLGSLGPKALDYLSKSLLYEKDSGNNANQLLHNQDYYVFFITAKEKLRGQLIADLIEKPKYKAVNRVIEEIETLIKMFDDFCKNIQRIVATQQQNSAALFNDNNQYADRSQDNYNRNRQQDFNKDRDDDNRYSQYQRGGGQMDQYRGSGNQYNEDVPNSNQYSQNRSISHFSNQSSNSNQYSRSNQGGVWQSGTYITFQTDANNPQRSIGGNHGNNRNQGDQGNQYFRNERNLNPSYGNASGSYSSNLGNRDSGYNQGNYRGDTCNDSQNRSDHSQQNRGYAIGNNPVYTTSNRSNSNSGFGDNI